MTEINISAERNFHPSLLTHRQEEVAHTKYRVIRRKKIDNILSRTMENLKMKYADEDQLI